MERQRRQLAHKSAELDSRVQDLLAMQEQLEEANRKLNELSLTDGLTRLANRRAFEEALQTEWRRALRNRHSLTLILADIDSFKQFNDTYGHVAGDDCLVRIAKVIKSPLMRSSDLVAVMVAKEFAFRLPDTDLQGGEHLAEEIRRAGGTTGNRPPKFGHRHPCHHELRGRLGGPPAGPGGTGPGLRRRPGPWHRQGKRPPTRSLSQDKSL
ncbi:MAG: GGDEF domain-containing protein [Desulfurivibrio sp.]|nr:GGDEF domain-containing protein [Desulfurivibrio sp.]